MRLGLGERERKGERARPRRLLGGCSEAAEDGSRSVGGSARIGLVVAVSLSVRDLGCVHTKLAVWYCGCACGFNGGGARDVE